MPFKGLPKLQVDQLFHKGPAVVEKTFVSRTKVVESSFAIGSLNKTILWALSVTHFQDFAGPAITG